MTASTPHEARRAEILARYRSEAAALTPCDRERALREGTWQHVVPGDPETGPSLAGWRDGPASTMPPEVRRDVSTAIPRPADLDTAATEATYWTERAEVREVLGAPPLPVWVRARRAILAEILGASQAQRPPVPPIVSPVPPPAEPAGAQDQAESAPSELDTPPRTREEARAAVRALFGEDLTDREIARRVGVSPSTVAAVRKSAT